MAILLVGGVCIFYTSLGGMKAVIWTDVYQSIWMFSGFAIILIFATIDFDGFGKILQIGNLVCKECRSLEYEKTQIHNLAKSKVALENWLFVSRYIYLTS